MDIPRGRPNRAQRRTFVTRANRIRMAQERWLASQVQKVLTSYRDAILKDHSDDGLIKARNEMERALKPIYTRFYTVMATTTMSVYDEDGKSVPIETKARLSDRLKKWLDKEVGIRIVRVSDSTHEQIKRWYAESDGDINKFNDKCATHFRPFRARRIAVTETTHCMNVSLMETAKSLSFGNELNYQWLASQQTNMREGHANADGQVRTEDGWFEVVNPLGVTEKLKHPADWQHGSACNCVNCRCLSVPFYAKL